MTTNEEQPTALSGKLIARIVEAINKRVRKDYVNVAGVDLKAWALELEAQVPSLANKSVEAFENAIREHLQQLKTSHTGFFHGVQARFLPQHSINATLKSVGSDGDGRWMFLDVFPEGPADKAGIRPGEILQAIDDTPSKPPDMPTLSTGNTYNVSLIGTNGQPRHVTVTVPFRKGTKQRPPIVEPKAVTHELIPQKVGLLRIPYFSGAAGMRFGTELSRAIRDLEARGAERLIVDLRGNIGGSLGFSMLASYLCPDQRPIGYSLTPKTVRNGYMKEKLPRVPMPATKASLLLTLAEFAFRDKSVVLLTQGLGPQRFHGKIVILVNEWTNSAGEMVASFGKENGLATVIGTKTAGNVLGAANFNVGGEYWLRLPIFGWMTWGDFCLEGKGVAPDLEVDNEPALLARDVDTQMDMARRVVSQL
ncbi:MAG: Carboxyl-terminal protease [Bryobacterales bacterium]|nr:Carboxyl-terminal protease [Bryobacterales bacterium]